MTRYYVEMTVNFSGEIEADSKEHAEELAWREWGIETSNSISYDSVDSIEVEEVEEEEDDEDE